MSVVPELANASQTQKPNFYYARHMQPGTCRYENETVLVDVEALKLMIGTGAGIPVFIHHQVGVAIDEVKDKACGYVVESFYNTLDGWAWFKFMAIDDEARLAIANGWSISNAYAPTKFAAGGTKNNVVFHRNVIDAKFTHLALVPNPRYENAKIYTPEEFKAYQEELKSKLELHNSLPSPAPSKGRQMFKFLRAKNEEVTNSADATHVELEGGKVVTAAEFKEMLNGKSKKNEGESSVDNVTMDNAACDVDGEKMTMKDLKNAYRKLNAMEKKNAEDEKAKKETEEKENAAKAKKNADDEAAKKKEEDEKTNGKGYYEQLLNARDEAKDATTVVHIDTGSTMTARGQSKYGSAPAK